MDNKATIIMASAIVAILLTSTIANQAFALPTGALGQLRGQLKADLSALRADLQAALGGGGSNSGGGGGSGGRH